jgi:hypothetical protein
MRAPRSFSSQAFAVANHFVPAAALLLILSMFCPLEPARAENWPAWRGPRGDGSSLEKNLPEH